MKLVWRTRANEQTLSTSKIWQTTNEKWALSNIQIPLSISRTNLELTTDKSMWIFSGKLWIRTLCKSAARVGTWEMGRRIKGKCWQRRRRRIRGGCFSTPVSDLYSSSWLVRRKRTDLMNSLIIAKQKREKQATLWMDPQRGMFCKGALQSPYCGLLGPKLFLVTGLVIFVTAVARLVSPDLLGLCLSRSAKIYFWPSNGMRKGHSKWHSWQGRQMLVQNIGYKISGIRLNLYLARRGCLLTLKRKS